MKRPATVLAVPACVAAALLLAACTSSSGSHPSPSASSTGHSTGPTPTSTTSSTPTSTTSSAPTSTTSSAPTSTTSSAPTSATPAAGPRTATVLGSGDVLIHPALTQQAHRDAHGHGYDFGPMYASIAPDVRSADLATCELETPLAPPQGPFTGWPDFSGPPQVLAALRGVGYDSCTTASNHSLDQGYTGLVRTLDELDAAGLKHTGSARTEREADTPLIITTADGVRIGQLAYSFNFNGHEPPAGRSWEANLIDVPRILAAAKAMKRAGADIVVVSMHWGTEYDHLATAQQKDEAAALLASPDIDLILGDHAHVVQPAQKINGKWVFYCMGNQISRHEDPVAEGREGVMPRVTFTETSPHHFRVSSAEAIPTWMQDSPDLRLVDLPRSLASGGLSAAHRAEQTAAHAAIVKALNAYGAVGDGLRIR